MRIVRGYWLVALGVIVFGLGVAGEIPVWAFSGAASFGWTAYAPLTSTTFTPSIAPLVPVFELAVGLGLIGAWVGFRVGRRSSIRASGTTQPPE